MKGYIYNLFCSDTENKKEDKSEKNDNQNYDIKYNKNEIIKVPLVFLNKIPIVEASLNGITRNFFLDSGAIISFLNSKYFLKEKEIDENIKDVSGKISNVFTASIKELNFAGSIIENQKMSMFDLSHLENNEKHELYGLLGYDFLKEYELYFDYKNKCITFLKPGNLETFIILNSLKQKQILPLTISKHLAIIDVSIAGKIYKLGLDSGCEAMLLETSHFSELDNICYCNEQSILLGADKNGRKSIRLSKINEIMIGNISLKGIRVVFSDISHINNKLDTHIDGIIGYPLFSSSPVFISYHQKKAIIF